MSSGNFTVQAVERLENFSLSLDIFMRLEVFLQCAKVCIQNPVFWVPDFLNFYMHNILLNQNFYFFRILGYGIYSDF